MGDVYEALRRAEVEELGNSPFRGQAWSLGDAPQPPACPTLSLDQVVTLQPETAVDPRFVALTEDQGMSAEQFRLLSIRLRDLQSQSTLRKILVTSSVSGEGKSVIAANLAASLARDAEQKVLLLGGDLRHLGLNRLLGCNGLPGLSEYLLGDAAFTNYLYRVQPLLLWFLPGGSKPSQAMQLLQSARLKELLDTLARSFDWVIIDSSPLLPLADANIWARMVDGTLLVVRQGTTPKKLLKKAIESLGSVPLLGVVVNECRSKQGSHYYQDSESQ